MISAEPLIVVPGRLYTTEETADYLRVLVKTLEVWRATQRYPTLAWKKSGSKVVYPGESILAFLNGPHQKAAPYVPKNRRRKLLPKRASRIRARKAGR
jgi:hypothetical protein